MAREAEDSHEAVAGSLYFRAVMCPDGLPDLLVVTSERGAGLLIAQAPDEFSRPFDVSEQNGDDAVGPPSASGHPLEEFLFDFCLNRLAQLFSQLIAICALTSWHGMESMRVWSGGPRKVSSLSAIPWFRP